MIWIPFFIGVFIGTFLGIFVAALCIIAGENESLDGERK